MISLANPAYGSTIHSTVSLLLHVLFIIDIKMLLMDLLCTLHLPTFTNMCSVERDAVQATGHEYDHVYMYSCTCTCDTMRVCKKPCKSAFTKGQCLRNCSWCRHDGVKCPFYPLGPPGWPRFQTVSKNATPAVLPYYRYYY